MKKILIYFALTTCLAISVQARNRDHHHHHHGRHRNRNPERDHQQPPAAYLNIDGFGNCYANDRGLSGRCVRFQSCHSAVRAWQQQQTQPLSCYYTTYENFVCCPDITPHPTTPYGLPGPSPYHSPFSNGQFPIVPQQPIWPTLAAHLPLQTPGEFLNRVGAQKLRERKSEQECADAYLRHNHRRTGHRSKRDSDPNDVDDGDEVITKVTQIKTEAVGGIPTTENEFPYMCALGWRSIRSLQSIVYNCGCVLIANRYVLTAAHCSTIGGESPSVVRLGGVDLDEADAEIIKIKRIKEHPEYDAELAYNDIAIVKLEKRSRETPACLWSTESLPELRLTAIGYGQTKFAGPSSNNLLKVFLSVLSNEECSAYYKPQNKLKHGVGVGHICAGDPANKMDTCQGDSGGPLLMQVSQRNTVVPYVVGITSFGDGCASGSPSVYTRISNYIDWIENEVWS